MSKSVTHFVSYFVNYHTKVGGRVFLMKLLSGLMISGDFSSESVGKSVEAYVPSTGQHCQLPDMPDSRHWHSMEEMTVCGGEYTETSCLTFSSNGIWERTTTLLVER